MNDRSKPPRPGWLPKWLAPRARPRIGVVTDSAACIPEAWADAADFERLSIPIIVDKVVHDEDLNALMMGLAMGHSVQTSRPAPGVFAAAYKKLAAAGCEQIISVHLSAALSGTVDAARLGAEQCEVPVSIIDSRTVGMAQGYAVADVLAARASGAGIGMLEQAAHTAALNSTFFAVPSLDQLRRGGRISAVSSVLGGLLNVKPILGINDGAIAAVEKPRSFARAQARLVALALQAARAANGPVRLGVMHFGAPDLAMEIARELQPESCEPVFVQGLPAVLAAHTGMGVLGVCAAPLYPQTDPADEPQSAP